jgi:hypothetical protein
VLNCISWQKQWFYLEFGNSSDNLNKRGIILTPFLQFAGKINIFYHKKQKMALLSLTLKLK